ncbi:MAG: Cof-type HAD-IIB family hydrolase [Deltaproteobacteria bacterium]|nr:Cof-type HAD-IIB family hydrolase [Deltaproteobacteria bacterium]
MSPSPWGAVYFDLDGTLLGPDGEVPVVVRDAVARVKARGVRVGLATGRRATTTAPYAALLGVDAPCVLFNGARVVDATFSTTLFATGLPHAAAPAVVERALAFGAHVVAYVDERLLCDVRSPRPGVPVGALSRSTTEVVDLTTLPVAPTKLVFVDDPPRLQALRALLHDEALVPAGAQLVRSGPRFLELLPQGAHKGAGLARSAAYLGVDPGSVIAFGDDENDREMLALAGLSFAMGHAPASVRAVAHRVIGGDVHDGGDALAAALDDVFGR